MYVIGFTDDSGTFYAITRDGESVTAVALDDPMNASDAQIWTASETNAELTDGTGYKLVQTESAEETVTDEEGNETTQTTTVEYGLKYSGSSVAAPTQNVKANWLVDENGKMYYMGGAQSNQKKYIAYADGAFTIVTTADEASVMTINRLVATSSKSRLGASYWTANVILATGVLDNSLITYSDLHEDWDHIGGALADVIEGHDGMIPALIVSTGDWSNSFGTAASVTQDTIERISLQMAGIDVVWVAGNHDAGQPASDASKAAKLGAADDYDGVGIIYDYRVDNDSVDSSAFIDTEETPGGLFVIGINYDEQENSYGTPDDPKSVCGRVKAALDSIAADYNGELIVVSAHAGLKVVNDDWSGDTQYNKSQANEMVKLLNKYAEDYDMDIMFYFGHDHTRGENELVLKPGDTIKSIVDYNTREYEEIVLNFTYGHAGYITSRNNTYYSFLTWDNETISRDIDKSDDGTEGFVPVSDISYTLDRTWKIGTDEDGEESWTWADDYSSATATFTRESNNGEKVVEATITSEDTATCAEGGVILYTATIAADVSPDGEEYTDTKEGAATEPNPAMHELEHYDATEATCTEEGNLEYWQCANCEKYFLDEECSKEAAWEDIEIGSNGSHDYVEEVTEPTCTEQGYTTYTCSACGDSYVDNYVEALGHSYDAVDTAATCTEQGYTTYTCSACGDSYVGNYVKALGHVYDAKETAATCTAQGYTTYTCSVCGDSYVGNYVQALGHVYDAVETDATCTDQGYTTYTCSVCGYSYVGDYVGALGHIWGAWEVTKEATETEAGEKVHTCTVCGEEETETIPVQPGEPEEITVILDKDGKSATVTGDYEGLYVRIAITVENAGETGLYITQGIIKDGKIKVPQFDVPGLVVTGVNVALVATVDEITMRNPKVIAMDYTYFD